MGRTTFLSAGNLQGPTEFTKFKFVDLPILEVKMKSPIFVNLENILSELGIGRTTMYQRIKLGTFPEIVKLGTRSLGWSSEEFEDVVNAIRAGLTDDEMRALVREIHNGRSKFKDAQPFKRRVLSYDPELDSEFCEQVLSDECELVSVWPKRQFCYPVRRPRHSIRAAVRLCLK